MKIQLINNLHLNSNSNKPVLPQKGQKHVLVFKKYCHGRLCHHHWGQTHLQGWNCGEGAAKILPRQIIEKPGERTPVCVHVWNVEKSSSSASSPPLLSMSSAPSPLFTSSTPDANTSCGRKKKRVESVSTDGIALGMSLLTKDEWILLLQAVKNLFL
jgi:hypothetical protein